MVLMFVILYSSSGDSSGPHCLLNGSSVDIQCVNFGFPRPEIVFFQNTELITPGQGNFTRFTQVSYDIMRLTTIQQGDSGDYVCEARMGTNELNRSQPERLVFCSKCFFEAFFPQQLLTKYNLSLFLTAQPAIESLPPPINHTEGDHFELVCSFTGIPAPQIHWEKNGSVFLLGEGRRGSSTVLGGHSWKSTAYCTVMQECTAVQSLTFLGM